ncbi:MAG: tripartite tricarboxylate transporter substrate binding protein [Thermodesulfobacteriota bacterium]
MEKTARILLGLVVAVSIALSVPPSQAQTYPNQPIQFVIPMTPGDTTDLTGRIIASELAKNLSATVVPINKPGGGATVGADFVAKGKKDGYTILYANSNIYYAHAMNPDTVPCNPLQDLDVLCLAVSLPIVDLVQAESPWKTMQELVDYMRKNPGKVRVSTTGVGGVGHFNHEVIRMNTGTESTMVPYKGASPALTALLGGHVETALLSTAVAPHINAGKLRALAISQKLKVPEFANVPTLKELGYKRDIVSVRCAFYAPVGIPDSVKKVLIPALEKSIKSEEVMRGVQQLNAFVDYVPASEFKGMMTEEYGMVRQLLKSSGAPQK